MSRGLICRPGQRGRSTTCSGDCTRRSNPGGTPVRRPRSDSATTARSGRRSSNNAPVGKVVSSPVMRAHLRLPLRLVAVSLAGAFAAACGGASSGPDGGSGSGGVGAITGTAGSGAGGTNGDGAAGSGQAACTGFSLQQDGVLDLD